MDTGTCCWLIVRINSVCKWALLLVLVIPLSANVLTGTGYIFGPIHWNLHRGYHWSENAWSEQWSYEASWIPVCSLHQQFSLVHTTRSKDSTSGVMVKSSLGLEWPRRQSSLVHSARSILASLVQSNWSPICAGWLRFYSWMCLVESLASMLLHAWRNI